MNKKIVLGFSVVLIGVIIYQTITIHNIKQQLEEIDLNNSSNISGVYSSINNINTNIQQTLNKELSKTHLTTDVNFKFNSADNNTYKLDLRVELKRAGNDSKVIFMYKGVNDNEWQQIELQKSNELSYVGQIQLNYEGNYEYKVVTKGTISESGDIETINQYDFMPKSPNVSFGASYDENITGKGFTQNQKIIDYILSAYYSDGNDVPVNGKMKISSIDVTANVSGEDKTYNCNYMKEERDEKNNELLRQERYEVNIPRTELEGEVKSVKMKITYDNGIIDFKDITEDFKRQYNIGW